MNVHTIGVKLDVYSVPYVIIRGTNFLFQNTVNANIDLLMFYEIYVYVDVCTSFAITLNLYLGIQTKFYKFLFIIVIKHIRND